MYVMPSSTATGNIVAFFEPEILLNLSETMCSCHQSQQGISIVPNSSKQKNNNNNNRFSSLEDLFFKNISFNIVHANLQFVGCPVSWIYVIPFRVLTLSTYRSCSHIGNLKIILFFWAIVMDMQLIWHLNKTLHQMQEQKPIRSPCYCRCCTSHFFKI